MARIIKYQSQYLSDRRIPIKANEYDSDGKVVYDRAPDPSAPDGTQERVGVPKLVTADTYALLDEVFMALASIQSIHKDDDSRRVMGIRNAIDEARDQEDGNRDVHLGAQSYKWLFEMFARTLPLGNTPEAVKLAKENGETPRRFSWALWRNSEASILNALRAEDDTDNRETSWADKDV